MFLKCEKGFTLIEMLLALTIWLMLCTMLLPKLMFVLVERKNIEIMNTGNIILNEELTHIFQDEWIGIGDEMIVKENITYHIAREFNDEIEQWELCLSWKDKRNRHVERCGYARK